MENKKELRNWLNAFGLDHPLVIAGPCSAETEEQVLKIAHQLKDTDATVLRAGIWKPRTRPDNFEGIGEIGLKWLKEAGEKSGLAVATEVANTKHVEAALENEIDILWMCVPHFLLLCISKLNTGLFSHGSNHDPVYTQL